jgi:hypothetical protein
LERRRIRAWGCQKKRTAINLQGLLYRFAFIIIFLTVFCTQINPVSAVGNETVPEEEVSIVDFFSDHSISDATVRFEHPLENVSLAFTLSSGKKALKSETFLLGHVEKGQEITKVIFWGLEEDFGKDRDSYTAQLFVKNSSEILDSRELSFSYRSPALSKLKIVDFSADSEKASVPFQPCFCSVSIMNPRNCLEENSNGSLLPEHLRTGLP